MGVSLAQVVEKRQLASHQCLVIYVTDYTVNRSCPIYERAQWCHPCLKNYILRVELWDAAQVGGSNMEKGEIYTLHNVRMKLGNNGKLEGKMKENKITKLGEPTLTQESKNLLE